MKTIDARGLACPEPVLLTKRAVDAGETLFDVLVDDEIPVENIKRFCDSYNCSLTEEQRTGYWKLTISPLEGSINETADSQAAGDENPTALNSGLAPATLLFTRDRIGDNEELGELLLEGLINTLPDSVNLPEIMIFLNSGVRLTTTGSHVLESLRMLESRGVEIRSCGTCLDYYGLKDKLCVGIITNMFETANRITAGGKVVSI